MTEWRQQRSYVCVWILNIYVRLICAVQINSNLWSLAEGKTAMRSITISNELDISEAWNEPLCNCRFKISSNFSPCVLFIPFHVHVYFIWSAHGEQKHVQLERDKLKQIINSKLRFRKGRKREKTYLSHHEQQRRRVLILRVCVDVPHRFTFQRDALIFKRICLCVMRV